MRKRLQLYKKFAELSWNEQLLLSEAFLLRLSTGLLLKIIPFKWVPRLFENKVQGTGHKVQGTLNLEPEPRCSRVRRRQTLNLEPGTIEQIRTAIQRSGQYSPWKNECLVSSLTARRMLNRRKISSELSLGVANVEHGKIIAHAWIKAGDFEIVKKKGDFQELYRF